MRRGRFGIAAASCLLAAAALAWLWQGRPAGFGSLAGAVVVPDSSPSPAYRLERVQLSTTSGQTVQCVLRSPSRRSDPRSLVGVVLLGGIGTGRRAATLVGTDFGGLVLSCDYPWRDPTTVSVGRVLLTLPALRREVLSTPDALAVAAGYLLARPELDPRRLAAVGASLGVPFVSAWAGGDPRVAAVALVMGGADLRAILAANLRGAVRVPALRGPVAALLGWLLRPLEPARTVARIAPRPVLVIGAADDERVPRRATELLFAAAGEPKAILWLGGRHLLPRDTALLAEITDSTFHWVTRHLPTRP